MSEVMLFDPEVEALLREIAADPRSSLLKVDRPKQLEGLFERYEKAGRLTPGITSAERHLVQVHREEVTKLIGDVCRRRLGTNNPLVNRSLTVDREVRIPEESEIRSRVGELRATNAELGEPGVEELLDQCVAAPGQGEPTVTQLATAMGRLVPSDTARVLGGLSLALNARPRAGLALFRTVLSGPASSLMKSVTWDNVGTVATGLEDLGLSIHAYRSATQEYEGRTSSQIVLLTMLINVRDEGAAMEAARELEDTAGACAQLIDWYVWALQEQLRRGEWSPSQQSRVLAAQIADRHPGIGRLMDAWS